MHRRRERKRGFSRAAGPKLSHWSARGAALVFALIAAGCETQEPEQRVASAVFGVFFGGQVQQRSEIPFEIDKKKQTQGLRIEFREPLRKPSMVKWEFDRPAPRGKRPTPSSRVVQLGEAEVRAGSRHFEVPLELSPGDPLGEWNVRALVDGRLVIDQRFLVYSEPARRAAARKADEDEDD